MEEHELKTVLVNDGTIFNNVKVECVCEYEYCENEDCFYADERQFTENNQRLKDAYRKKVGLLTSEDISGIRAKYGISQADLSSLLGWGGKTITRYESYQVQDKAHDSILKKLNEDPQWYISLLGDAKPNLSENAFRRYMAYATKLYEMKQDDYLRKSIEAAYAPHVSNSENQGNAELSLDKAVDVIRYFAASKDATSLYTVKLMKLLWYADALSYKKHGHAITGLVYQALPMGAVPIAYNSIINLKGVPREEVEIGEATVNKFTLEKKVKTAHLSKEEISILDEVINSLGKMSKEEIVSFMHKEKAYTETKPKDIISFKYAEYLQI
ncbi:MAG: DUF4065 domain-containing protein [Lachnospiraceae bacterium]|nr:DUF4065 domain-containing protein [Lachnospiraceae bacterium]